MTEFEIILKLLVVIAIVLCLRLKIKKSTNEKMGRDIE